MMLTENNTPEPIKTALIGFGFSGQKFHAPFLKALPSYKLTHVVGSQSDLIRELNESIRIVAKEEIDVVFKNPKIELVVITAPNNQHYPLAKQALLHGKHVVIEKPFVLNSEEGRELISLAHSKGRVLSVFHNRRWDSDFLTLQSLLNRQSLGDIYSFRACYDRYRPLVNNTRWKESSKHGAGTLWDLGAHLIDQALHLFGWPESVFADAFPQRPGAQAVDCFDVFLSYSSGLRVHLSSRSLALVSRAKYEVHGVKGSFVKFGRDPQEESLINNICPLTANFGGEDQSQYGKLSLFKDNQIHTELYPSKLGSYKDYFLQLAMSIKANGPPPVSAESALNVIHLIEACEQSCKRKQAIQLSPSSQ